MSILNTIKTNIETTVLNRLNIKGEVKVFPSFFWVTVATKNEAETLENAFKKSFSEVSIEDLSEIGEAGFMLDVRI